MLQTNRLTAAALRLSIFIAASSPLANAQDGNSLSSRGSIIGFAVVLSFLVLSILVVMLICSCYGLCKFPCKRSVPRERRAHPSRTRPMIPLPSPGPGTIKASTSSTFQQGHKSSTVNHQAMSRFHSHSGRHHLPQQSFTDGDRRRDSLSPSRYSAPPSAASNVIHLSQLPSLSCHSDLEQFAQMQLQGSANPPPTLGRQGGGRGSHSHSKSHSYQQRSEQTQGVSRQTTNTSRTNNDSMATASPHPPPFQAKPVDIPPPYPGMGYPYTPCKSPNTPHGTAADLSHSQLHSRRRSNSRQNHNHAGSGVVLSGAESELTTDIDTMTEGETNSVVSGRGARHVVDIVTAPPAYSTEV